MCIFCKIVSKDIPNYTIYEDEKVLAFLDVNPATRGHSLVVPKLHSDNFLEEENISYLLERTQFIAKHIYSVLQPKGMRIQTNINETAGQSVFHTHIHILPVYEKNDQVGNLMELNDNTLSEIQNLLRM